MSSRGGGAARLATRLREQTASAGAAGAEPTSGTPQRNRPCQCHRPSRGKASILPSKCALFLPGAPPLAIVPGSPAMPPRPPRRSREALCARQPRRASAAAPAAPSLLPPHRCGGAWGEPPELWEGAAGSKEAQFPQGRASRTRSSHRGVGGMTGERGKHPAARAFGFSIPRDPLCPIPDSPVSLQPIGEKGQGCYLRVPNFHVFIMQLPRARRTLWWGLGVLLRACRQT